MTTAASQCIDGPHMDVLLVTSNTSDVGTRSDATRYTQFLPEIRDLELLLQSDSSLFRDEWLEFWTTSRLLRLSCPMCMFTVVGFHPDHFAHIPHGRYAAPRSVDLGGSVLGGRSAQRSGSVGVRCDARGNCKHPLGCLVGSYE